MSFALLLLLVVAACLSPVSATLHTVTDADYECTAVELAEGSTADARYQRVMCGLSYTQVALVSYSDQLCADVLGYELRDSGYQTYVCPATTVPLNFTVEEQMGSAPFLLPSYTRFVNANCTDGLQTTFYFPLGSCLFDPASTTKQQQLAFGCSGAIGTLLVYNSTAGTCSGTAVSTTAYPDTDVDPITGCNPDGVKIYCAVLTGANAASCTSSPPFNLVAMGMLLAWVSFGW